MKRILLGVFALTAAAVTSASAQAGGAPAGQQAQRQPMGFFVTSVGKGDGANLGGLAGADAHCQSLASAAGFGNRVWRAYLSAAAGGGQAPVNARDRIGEGPWYNAAGVLIAWNVADLHGDFQRDRNNVTKAAALDEKGQQVTGSGDTPNKHDILTGSDSHGRLPIGSAAALTCNNWTSNAAGSAMVGHHDRVGGGNTSWNAVHLTRGCSPTDLAASGGAGLFYCFAAS